MTLEQAKQMAGRMAHGLGIAVYVVPHGEGYRPAQFDREGVAVFTAHAGPGSEAGAHGRFECAAAARP